MCAASSRADKSKRKDQFRRSLTRLATMDHEDIGRRILNQLRIQYDHRTKDRIYIALFKLNYLRGVEYGEMHDIYVQDDSLHGLTKNQQEYLEERSSQLGGSAVDRAF